MTANAKRTLVEVALILGVACALAAAGLLLNREPGESGRTAKRNERALNKALDDYYADHGRWPASLDALTRPPRPYCEVLPVEPRTGTAGSWLVTSKTHLPADRWFTQAEFPAADTAKEGVLRVKRSR